MVVAVVVLSIACAELAIALGIFHYRYIEMKKDLMDSVVSMALSEMKDDDKEEDSKEEDDERYEVDLSFPNSEGF